MRGVTDPPRTPDPSQPQPVAGERRLARAPSERYGTTPTGGPASSPPRDGEPTAPASGGAAAAAPARGIAFGAIAALLGAALIVLFGGALAVSAGLLVVASAVGYAVGLATVIGAADTLSGGWRPWIAGALAGLGVLLGQVGLWLYARAEGGVLAPIDYLSQTFGPLVPVEVVLGAVVAWWRAR
jgi:hypothetical protein